MRCPKCGHEFKDEGRARGGRTSRRTITPDQQARMQAARKRCKADRHNPKSTSTVVDPLKRKGDAS